MLTAAVLAAWVGWSIALFALMRRPRKPFGYIPFAVHDEIVAGLYGEIARERLLRIEAEKLAAEAEKWALAYVNSGNAR